MYIEKDEMKYQLLAYNLARHGFPMMHDGLNTKKLSIEELIVKNF